MKKKGTFDIINDISEHFTLVKLMETLGNLSRAISIVGYWIFDYNYEQTLCMKRESLDLIYSPSIGAEQVFGFETVSYAVRYVWSPGNIKIG